MPSAGSERLWSNLLEIVALPTKLLRIHLRQDLPDQLVAGWPHYVQEDGVVLAFALPEGDALDRLGAVERIAWKDRMVGNGLRLSDVVTYLVGKHVRARCVARGLRETPDGSGLYFPPGLVANDRLTFSWRDGKRWVRAVGQRRFRLRGGEREATRYHLAPAFRANVWRYPTPILRVQTRVQLADLDGRPLEDAKARRRRKAICKNWWNYEWLARLLGIVSWLADGAETMELITTSEDRLALAATPLCFQVPVGIDETMLRATPEDTEDEDHELGDDDVDNDEGADA